MYRVARVFTLTTEAIRPDGRLFVLPNFTLQSNKLCNRTRSKPYTLMLSLELANDVRSEQILDFSRALSRWLADDPLTWGEAVVHLDAMNPDGKCAAFFSPLPSFWSSFTHCIVCLSRLLAIRKSIRKDVLDACASSFPFASHMSRTINVILGDASIRLGWC